MNTKFNKQPFIEVKGYENNHSWAGYGPIIDELKLNLSAINKEKKILAIDFYPGVRVDEIRRHIIKEFPNAGLIHTDEAIFYSCEYVTDRIKDHMTEDRVFGVMSHHQFKDFIDPSRLQAARKQIEEADGLIIIYGVAAGLIIKPDIHIYLDLARWEIQQRYRNGELPNWKHNNYNEDTLRKYKRGFFFEWRMADSYKKEHFEDFDYILDTNLKAAPRMITAKSFLAGLERATTQPFSVVPFFDPGVWGGQWMKEVCDLERNAENYAWCFNCVPEENSLLLKVGDVVVEVPSINLVFKYPRALLGEKVHARFGTEFPIRFDLLDTMEGGNLSLQVHPLTEYIQECFGMHYTQDESYYMLDAKEDAHVYLGVKTGTTKEKFFGDLVKAQEGEMEFSVEKYINKISAKKHDHFLIPAGTAHCSGADSMVLEVSSTPYIFTFKLWDWGRLGLDGKPRPIHMAHGSKVLQFDRDTEWTMNHLVNQIQKINDGDGWREERTGLHDTQFIETRRHWFSVPVLHDTNGEVNVLNLVEGEQAIVESPEGGFEPFIVNYAETFIVPAAVGKYAIRPYGASTGKEIATIKAYVRF